MPTPREELAKYATQAQMSSFFIDKMGIYNVKSYEATGDGLTDDYSYVNNAEAAADDSGGIVFFPTGTYVISTNLTFSSNTTLWFAPGAKLSPSVGVTITIQGDIIPSQQQIFTGSGTISVSGSKVNKIIPEWWGAVGDGTTNDYAAINATATACGTSKTMFLAEKTYAYGTSLTVTCQIEGISPLNSILYYTGASNALTIEGAGYYALFKRFQVKGTSSSQDGIVLDTDESYMNFEDVYSTYNGRHGLYMNETWATRFLNCKFHYNTGLGIYIYSDDATPGVANGVTFTSCESRHNGGTDAATTFSDNKGGVKIVGGASVSFIGGVYESNNAWNFIIGTNVSVATRDINIRNIYAEICPNGATTGGHFYASPSFSNVNIEESWVTYGAATGKTGYCFYIDRGDGSVENGAVNAPRDKNTFIASGAGTNTFSSGIAKKKMEKKITKGFGDVAGAGSATVQTLLTASTDGAYKIAGMIYVGRDTEIGGTYPFIAGRYGSTNVSSVGSAIVGNSSTPPTMAWSSSALQVTFAAYHYGFVELSAQYNTLPTSLTFNSTLYEPITQSQEIPW